MNCGMCRNQSTHDHGTWGQICSQGRWSCNICATVNQPLNLSHYNEIMKEFRELKIIIADCGQEICKMCNSLAANATLIAEN